MSEDVIKARLAEAKSIIEVITISNGLKAEGADIMLVNKCTKEARENLIKMRDSVNPIKRVSVPVPSQQKFTCIPFEVDSLSNPYLSFTPGKGVSL